MVFMNGILPDNEYTEVESRSYLNPQLQIDETSTFIDNLRQAQQANNAEIAAQTRALGTEVSSNLGGLVGGEGYFTSRYQTPQFNSLAQSLRTSARASALNQALENDLAIWKNRQQQAYRNYQKRAYDRSNSGNPGTTQNPGTTPDDSEPDNITNTNTTLELGSVSPEAIANSRYQTILNKYLRAGYPTAEAEKRAREDFGKSIDVNAPVAPYGSSGQVGVVSGVAGTLIEKGA